MTRLLKARAPGTLDAACDVLGRGGLAAIPTETVYGLAADAANGAAVARIYEVKGRPSFNPLIAHCADLGMARRHGVFGEAALACARRFWPGPLTLVVPYAGGEGISALARAGLPTVALRVPDGASAEIIAKFARPLAAPSANLSGRVSPTAADHVMRQLGGRIDLIVDGGPCEVGVESTIVSFAGEKPVLLRPGGVSGEVLEEALGEALLRPGEGGPVAAPGMLASHYAPLGAVRLDAADMRGEDGALNFGGSRLEAEHTLSLSGTGDLREAAARLFACLAAFDERGVRRIAVAPVPERGLGAAINDRLRRAAAPRG